MLLRLVTHKTRIMVPAACFSSSSPSISSPFVAPCSSMSSSSIWANCLCSVTLCSSSVTAGVIVRRSALRRGMQWFDCHQLDHALLDTLVHMICNSYTGFKVVICIPLHITACCGRNAVTLYSCLYGSQVRIFCHVTQKV